jgi:hypothetical protein
MNSFRNAAGNWVYKQSSVAASRYEQDSGYHIWYNAPSGTAGDAISFTQAMTLSANGQFIVGRTTAGDSSSALTASINNNGPYVTYFSNESTSTSAYNVSRWAQGAAGSAFGYIGTGGSAVGNASFANNFVIGTQTSNPLVFNTGDTERARIDSSGRLLVNQTSTAAGADGILAVTASSGSTQVAATFKTFDGASQYTTIMYNAAGTGNNLLIGFATEAAYTNRGSISYNRAGGLIAYNTTSDYRAKDIFGPVIDSGSVIDSVPVYMGKMKGATQERPMFIAHETPAYAHTGGKDAVDDDGKPVYQQMDASALIPVMWAEIQSLRKRLAAAGI